METALAGKAKEKKEPARAPSSREAPAPPAGLAVSVGVPLFVRRSPAPGGTPCTNCGGAPIGAPDDPAEVEAEAVARAVSTGASAPPPTAEEAPVLRREPATEAAPPTTPAFLPASDPGAPMSPRARGALEGSLGVDLGGVRVHKDAPARDTAASLQARAFTYGNQIWLGPGESDENVELMAHETAHVLQQGPVVRRKPAAGAPAAPPAPKGGKGGDKGKKGEAGAKAPAADKGKGKAKGEGAAAPGAEAGAGPAAEGGAAGAGPELLMPEPPTELSAEEKARAAKVKEQAGEAAEATADMPPEEEVAGDARAAVEEPTTETQGRAQEGLVASLDDREPPSAEIEELCEKIRQVIRDKRPPDEDSLVKAKPEEMSKQAGGELNSSVEGDAKKVQGSYDEMKTPPAGEPAQTPEGLTPPPASVETPPVNATAATPNAVPEENVSLDGDVQATQAKMDEAGMNTEPAKLVDSGPIADARAAEGELSEMAAKDPAEVLAGLAKEREGASADMAALQAKAKAALKASREKTAGGVEGQQTGMVETEEQTRNRIGTEARGIFDTAQKEVDALLKDLPSTAMKRWDTGVKELSEKFKQRLKKVEDWIEERHSGVGGAVLSVVDYVSGLPDWVTEAYDAAERDFGDGVCKLIREISSEVNTVVASCEGLIATARKDIAKLFADLPTALQEWAAQEQAKLGEQLDGLKKKATDTRDNFNKDLIKRASESVQEVRQQIHGLREAAKGLIGRALDAIAAFLDDPARAIVNGLLKLLGIEPSSFWALVDRIASVIDSIADDPMGFANNLMAALGKGFNQFFDNFGTHLIAGFFDWLTSGLAGIGVQIPKDFSLKSILTFMLSLMGITWANIRKMLVKHIGEKNMALIEKAVELLTVLIDQGPEGIYELIKEKLNPQTIVDKIIEVAVQMLVEALIKQVAVRIIGMLNPAGAILQALEAIYRVIKWVFENAARIFTLVETIVNGVADLIAGNIGGMANAVEKGLARLIAPVIDFLADYIGLGDLPEKVKETIEGFQKTVLGYVEAAIDFLAEKAKGLLKSLGIGGKDKPGDKEPGEGQVGEVIPFSADGEGHKLWIDTEGTAATPMVASDTPSPVERRLTEWEGRLDTISDAKEKGKAKKLIGEARSLNVDTDRTADEMVRKQQQAAGGKPPKDALSKTENQLATVLQQIFDIFGDDPKGGKLAVRFESAIAAAAPAARPALKEAVEQLDIQRESQKPSARKDFADWEALLAALGGEVARMLDGPLNSDNDFGKFAHGSLGVPAVKSAVRNVEKGGSGMPPPPKAKNDPDQYLTDYKGVIHKGAGNFLESKSKLVAYVKDVGGRGAASTALAGEFTARMENGDDLDHNLFEPDREKSSTSGKTTILKYGYAGFPKMSFTVTMTPTKTTISGANLNLKSQKGIDIVGRGVTQRPAGWETDELLNASHLIADQFMGSGYRSSANLVIASAHFNQRVMKGVEDTIAARIRKDQIVDFSMTVSVTWGEIDGDATVYQEIMAKLPTRKQAAVEAKVRAFVKRVQPIFKRVMNVEYSVQGLSGRTGKNVSMAPETGPDAWLGL